MASTIVTVANGITLFRLVLFGVFVWMLFIQDLPKAIIFFGLAWALDAIDGLVARALNQASEFGSQLDKIVDRLILCLGLLFLIKTEYLPPEALLLLTRDFALLPAITLHAMRNESLQGMGRRGKALTFLQGTGILWLLFGWPYAHAVIAVVAGLGGVFVTQHLIRIHRQE